MPVTLNGLLYDPTINAIIPPNISASYSEIAISSSYSISSSHTPGVQVNVTSFGAVGNGIVDDTIAIQSAINYVYSGSLGRLIIPHGTYLVGTLLVPSNVYIDSVGATLKRKPELTIGQTTLLFNNVNNAGVIGHLIIDGNASNQTINPVDDAPSGITINLSSSHLTFESIITTNCKCDGIYIGHTTGSNCPFNISFNQVYSNNNNRNNISITSGKNIYFGNTYCYNATSSAPNSGVDIEPNFATDIIDNIFFDNLTCDKNNGSGVTILGILSASNYVHGNITFNSLTVSNNNVFGLELTNVKNVHIHQFNCFGNATGIYIPTDIENVYIYGDIHNNQQRGISAVATAYVLGIKNIFIGGSIYNNSQLSAGTYDGVVLDTFGISQGPQNIILNINSYDNQSIHTQRYGVVIGNATGSVLQLGYSNGNTAGNYINGGKNTSIIDDGKYVLPQNIIVPSITASLMGTSSRSQTSTLLSSSAGANYIGGTLGFGSGSSVKITTLQVDTGASPGIKDHISINESNNQAFAPSNTGPRISFGSGYNSGANIIPIGSIYSQFDNTSLDFRGRLVIQAGDATTLKDVVYVSTASMKVFGTLAIGNNQNTASTLLNVNGDSYINALSGKLGVGVSSPGATLHVQGNISCSVITASAFNFVTSSSPPSNTSSILQWVSVTFAGDSNIYKMPLYL